MQPRAKHWAGVGWGQRWDQHLFWKEWTQAGESRPSFHLGCEIYGTRADALLGSTWRNRPSGNWGRALGWPGPTPFSPHPFFPPIWVPALSVAPAPTAGPAETRAPGAERARLGKRGAPVRTERGARGAPGVGAIEPRGSVGLEPSLLCHFLAGRGWCKQAELDGWAWGERPRAQHWHSLRSSPFCSAASRQVSLGTGLFWGWGTYRGWGTPPKIRYTVRFPHP